MSEFNGRIKHKVDTLENWNSTNPVLLDGEIGVARDTSGAVTMKVGNGTDAWKDLPKVSGDSSIAPQVVNAKETVLWEGECGSKTSTQVNNSLELSQSARDFDMLGFYCVHVYNNNLRYKYEEVPVDTYIDYVENDSSNSNRISFILGYKDTGCFWDILISSTDTTVNTISSLSYVTKIVGIKFQESSTYEVDEEPTEGSTNLITSGGVKKYVDDMLEGVELILSEL